MIDHWFSRVPSASPIMSNGPSGASEFFSGHHKHIIYHININIYILSVFSCEPKVGYNDVNIAIL